MGVMKEVKVSRKVSANSASEREKDTHTHNLPSTVFPAVVPHRWLGGR